MVGQPEGQYGLQSGDKQQEVYLSLVSGSIVILGRLAVHVKGRLRVMSRLSQHFGLNCTQLK